MDLSGSGVRLARPCIIFRPFGDHLGNLSAGDAMHGWAEDGGNANVQMARIAVNNGLLVIGHALPKCRAPRTARVTFTRVAL